ncbi:hypothetical protein MMC24_000852 [Lignoscripta atroalba]|nr:hypothetical protein [Lignoscripta atroalba]
MAPPSDHSKPLGRSTTDRMPDYSSLHTTGRPSTSSDRHPLISSPHPRSAREERKRQALLEAYKAVPLGDEELFWMGINEGRDKRRKKKQKRTNNKKSANDSDADSSGIGEPVSKFSSTSSSFSDRPKLKPIIEKFKTEYKGILQDFKTAPSGPKAIIEQYRKRRRQQKEEKGKASKPIFYTPSIDDFLNKRSSYKPLNQPVERQERKETPAVRPRLDSVSRHRVQVNEQIPYPSVHLDTSSRDTRWEDFLKEPLLTPKIVGKSNSKSSASKTSSSFRDDDRPPPVPRKNSPPSRSSSTQSSFAGAYEKSKSLCRLCRATAEALPGQGLCWQCMDIAFHPSDVNDTEGETTGDEDSDYASLLSSDPSHPLIPPPLRDSRLLRRHPRPIPTESLPLSRSRDSSFSSFSSRPVSPLSSRSQSRFQSPSSSTTPSPLPSPLSSRSLSQNRSPFPPPSQPLPPTPSHSTWEEKYTRWQPQERQLAGQATPNRSTSSSSYRVFPPTPAPVSRPSRASSSTSTRPPASRPPAAPIWARAPRARRPSAATLSRAPSSTASTSTQAPASRPPTAPTSTSTRRGTISDRITAACEIQRQPTVPSRQTDFMARWRERRERRPTGEGTERILSRQPEPQQRHREQQPQPQQYYQRGYGSGSESGASRGLGSGSEDETDEEDGLSRRSSFYEFWDDVLEDERAQGLRR